MTLNDPEKRSEYDLYLDNEASYNLVRKNVRSETPFRNFSCPEDFERQFFTSDFPEMYFCNFSSETNTGNKRFGNSSRKSIHIRAGKTGRRPKIEKERSFEVLTMELFLNKTKHFGGIIWNGIKSRLTTTTQCLMLHTLHHLLL